MAMTPAERKRKQIERDRMELRRLPDSSYAYLSQPFFQWLEEDGNWSDVELYLGIAGILPPEFTDDRGPEHFVGDGWFDGAEQIEEIFAGAKGSVGRAESMVGLLLDAATTLATIIRNYKLSQLEAHKRQIEEADLADPAKRKEAVENLLRIEKIKEALQANVRRTIPQWEVKGI